eukprot:24635-Eustigmatos_ZCMA.PRE.1
MGASGEDAPQHTKDRLGRAYGSCKATKGGRAPGMPIAPMPVLCVAPQCKAATCRAKCRRGSSHR